MRRRLLWLLATLAVLHVAPSRADEAIVICFNYGCQSEALVIFSEVRLEQARRLLAVTSSPEEERVALSRVVGRLYAWAGEQTPIRADKGGNYNDGEVQGRMDCIDHATTTTRFLEMIELRGWLRFHRVLPPKWRHLFIVSQHTSAVIEELGPMRDPAHTTPEQYVVDSWFRDNGRPAVILPLEEWLDGGGAEDEN
jgi:hypothetical protein